MTSPPDWVPDPVHGGLVADAGPYLGPWPVMPPGVTAGATEFWNVTDFFIALPNPAAPTDPAAAFDGTFPTGVWIARRSGDATTESTSTSWSTEAFGGANAPVPGAQPDPGLGYHLYVHVDYTPALPPAGYVSVLYATVGTATFYTEPGGWSDWQPAYTVDRPALLCTAGGRLMDYPPFGPAEANTRHLATAAGVDGGEVHSDAAVVGQSVIYPPPYVDVVDWAESDGWPPVMAQLVAGGAGGDSLGGAWQFCQIYNHYSNFFALGFYSITTWSRIRVQQARDGWQAQTNPVAPPDAIDYTGPLVYGVDYADPPFGVFPHYGGNTAPEHDLPGYTPTYGIGFPGYPDRFDHEAPKAVPEWLNVEAYLVPYLPEEVHFGLTPDTTGVEFHAEDIDVYLGSPPLTALVDGRVLSIDNESGDLNDVVNGYEGTWIDPAGSAMTHVDQWPLTWTGDSGTATGTVTPRSVPVAFGDNVRPGTELVTVLMQPNSATTGELNPALIANIPIPPRPGFLDYHDTGAESEPVYGKNFDAYIPDPYAPLRAGPGAGVPTVGVPVRMHEPRWRYWRPDKVVPSCPPGTVPVVTVTEGHWSEWQPGVPAWFDIPDAAETRHVARRGTRDVGMITPHGGTQPTAFWLTAIRDAIMGGGQFPGVFTGAITSVTGGHLGTTEGDYDSVTLTLGYVAARYDAADADPASASGDGLDVPGNAVPPETPGPNTYGLIDYETYPLAEFLGWDDLFLSQSHQAGQNASTPTDLVNPWGTDLRASFSVGHGAELLFTLRGTLGADQWLPYPAGSVVARADMTVSDATVGVLADGDPEVAVFSYGYTDTDLPTSTAVTAPTFWVVAQPSHLANDPEPGVDYPTFPLVNGQEFEEARGRWQARVLAVNLSAYLRAQYLTPRWRYWLPSGLAVECRVLDDWLRLNQRGDQYSRDPSTRLGAAAAPRSKLAGIRVGETNTFR
jgi:hypothetical protein